MLGVSRKPEEGGIDGTASRLSGAEAGQVPSASTQFLCNQNISNCMYAVAQLFEILRYKPEGRWFDSRSGL